MSSWKHEPKHRDFISMVKNHLARRRVHKKSSQSIPFLFLGIGLQAKAETQSQTLIKG